MPANLGYGPDESGFEFQHRPKNSLQNSRTTLEPTQLRIQYLPKSLPAQSSNRGREVNNPLHLVPRLRMSGAIPLLRPIRLHDVERENFTFTADLLLQTSSGFTVGN